MPLFTGTQQQYYGSQNFIGDASAGPFTLSFPNNLVGSPSNVTMPTSGSEFNVTVAGVLQVLDTHYTYNATNYQITFTSGNFPANGADIVVSLLSPSLGNYQFINLTNTKNIQKSILEFASIKSIFLKNPLYSNNLFNFIL